MTAAALAVAGGAAFYGVLAWDKAPAHPALAASELPPLIPARAFYADPRSRYGYRPSHDGRFVAFVDASFSGQEYKVSEVDSGEILASFPVQAGDLRWHPEKPLLRFMLDGEDWEADPRAPARENWRKISPRGLEGWHRNSRPVTAEEPLVVAAKAHLRTPVHLYHVSQDGSQVERVGEGSDDTLFWVLDTQRLPVLRIDNVDGTAREALRRTQEGWRPLFQYTVNDIFSPAGAAGPDNTALFLSNRGRDTVALVRVDLATGAETVVEIRPGKDAISATSLGRDHVADFVRFGYEEPERVALTPRGQAFLDILNQFPQPVDLGFLEGSADGRYQAAALSPQEDSFIYVLMDLEEGTHRLLAEYHFRRYAAHLSETRAVRFTARDGLEIPAVLTEPEGAAGAVPYVVMVHGGPFAADGWRYEHFKQFLANRGYGVLSVNFRGSHGHGKAFQEAGFREFGRAMQDDIADAAQWLVAEGLADPEALAVMGTSYGGYAAAMAMVRDPGLFSAAVVEFPLTDVVFQSRHYPWFWRTGLGSWTRYFGDPDDPADLGLMRQHSPITHVDKLAGPVLLLGGEKDPVTAVQQAKDFEAAALAAGKDVTAHYFADAGHGVTHWREKLARARLIEDFLARHLGGRSGRFDYAEIAAAFLD
ncbi:alpha/beta hydrolase family protein [Roseobacteraceae bacterium NS-SX3]